MVLNDKTDTGFEWQCYSSHLHERKDEAHSEVGHPVKWTSNYVGCWAVGLFKQLCSYQEGDPRWNRTSTNGHETNKMLMCLGLIKQYAFRTDRIISSGLCGQSKQTPQTKTFMFRHKLRWHNKSYVYSTLYVQCSKCPQYNWLDKTWNIFYLRNTLVEYDMKIIQGFFSSQQ